MYLTPSTYVPYTNTTILCPIEDEWEEEVIIIKKRKRKVSVCPTQPWNPLPHPWFPVPATPWKPLQPDIVWQEDNERCAIQEFFKNNPRGTCMLVCFCRKCRVWC